MRQDDFYVLAGGESETLGCVFKDRRRSLAQATLKCHWSCPVSTHERKTDEERQPPDHAHANTTLKPPALFPEPLLPTD